MPVRAIQKKWALRTVLFPWEIGGYMALAVLIAVMADGLAWALDIGVAVLAGAAAACIVQFALSRNLRTANSAGQRVGRILTHYVLGIMEGRVAEAFRKADENPQASRPSSRASRHARLVQSLVRRASIGEANVKQPTPDPNAFRDFEHAGWTLEGPWRGSRFLLG